MVKYVYDAWGCHKILSPDGTEITDGTHIGKKNPFRYRGYYYSEALELYALAARFYDPKIGRFICADTVDYLDPESPNGLNLFSYCHNNPVMYSDPSGHVAFLTMLGIVLVSSLIGAASGATVGGITYAIEAGDNFNLRDFGASVAGGAVSGAVTGAASGIVLFTGGTAGTLVGAFAGAGALSGLGGSLTEGAINGQLQEQGLQYWQTEIFPSALWGGAFGALFGAMSGPVLSAGALAQKAGRTLAKQLTKILVHKVIKKAGGNLLENLLWDFTTWLGEFGTKHAIRSTIG